MTCSSVSSTLHRLEGAGANVQGDVRGPMPAASSAAISSRREMQAGGRRGDRAVVSGEHGLVVGAVALVGVALARDVGRQRHGASASRCSASAGAAAIEGDASEPSACLARRPCREAARRSEGVADPQPLAAPRTKASQRSLACWRISSASTLPPLVRVPMSRAGMTLVSLNTSRSPGCSSLGRSRTLRSCSPSAATSSSRALSRGLAGRWAISSGKGEIEQVDAHLRWSAAREGRRRFGRAGAEHALHHHAVGPAAVSIGDAGQVSHPHEAEPLVQRPARPRCRRRYSRSSAESRPPRRRRSAPAAGCRPTPRPRCS